jgi:hypothetical protein
MENEKAITVISPAQPVVVTPSAEVIVVRPVPRQAIVIKPASVIVVEPQPIKAVIVQPSEVVTVTPPERGAWDERGWTRAVLGESETYEGHYAVGTRRFRGRIEVRGKRRRTVQAYIYDPPYEIKQHPHGACFQLVGDDWFYLHWARPARNIDDAILYMERVLDESLNG